MSQLEARAQEVAIATVDVEDPKISIVVKTKNSLVRLVGLFQDFESQEFDNEKEIIVVDAESNDGTRAVARWFGATLVSISQTEFSYPKAINMGFEAASHPYVFTFVGNSALSNNQTLRVASRWQSAESFAGAYGTVLPGDNASIWERMGAEMLGIDQRLQPAAPVKKLSEKHETGFMCSAASVVVRRAWQEAGGYNEAYGRGGDDGALGNTFLESGQTVVLDPALSVYHTNDLSFRKTIQQLQAWRDMAHPHDFDATRVDKYNPSWY